MGNQKENNISQNNEDTKITEMVIRVIGGRTYYTRRDEAESVRRMGDRIYYEPGAGYYIVRPQRRRDPWAHTIEKDEWFNNEREIQKLNYKTPMELLKEKTNC